MSFTSEVKKEASLLKLEGDDARAQLSALVQMTSSISISSRGMSLIVTTGNASVSRAVYSLMKQRYEVEIESAVKRRMNLKKNLIYILRIYGPIRKILEDLGIYSTRGLLDKPLQKIVSKESCARAYLMGAFMAEGSVNSPENSNYHLEIKAMNEAHADFLMDLMERFNIPSKTIERRSKVIVYVKQAEKIGDFLRCIGTTENLFKFEDARISRDFVNSMQRLNNVEVANVVKSMKAANRQLDDIQILEEYDLIKTLDSKLQDVIRLRKENPESSLTELMSIYEEVDGVTVSKSGMNHRFVKIHKLAQQARKEREL